MLTLQQIKNYMGVYWVSRDHWIRRNKQIAAIQGMLARKSDDCEVIADHFKKIDEAQQFSTLKYSKSPESNDD